MEFVFIIIIASIWGGVGFFYTGLTNGADLNKMGKGVLLFAAALFVAMSNVIARGLSRCDITTLFLGIIFYFVFTVLIIIDLIKIIPERKKEATKSAEKIGANNLDRFFVECVLAEANDFSKQKNVQRAQLIADKYKLKYPKGIEALYQKGFEAHKAVSNRFVLNYLEEKRQEEKKEYQQLIKYSNLKGKDKRITMLRHRAEELRQKSKDEKQYARMVMKSGQQKERDWALWGGAANGIGGAGVGIATAIDIQMQNFQIREENEKRRLAALPQYLSMTDSAERNRKNADTIMKEIEDFKLKLISDLPTEDVFQHITFSNTDVFVSETGAAMICTLASVEPDFMIFDDIPAVIDGTIKGNIYDGNKLCGTAELVLPLYGLGQNIPLNGICMDCCEPGKTYSVQFEPKHLWAMER